MKIALIEEYVNEFKIEGFKEGFSEGFSETYKASMEKIINDMIDNGCSIEEISKATGFNFDKMKKYGI